MKQEGHMIINNMPTGIVLLGRFFFLCVCLSLSLLFPWFLGHFLTSRTG